MPIEYATTSAEAAALRGLHTRVIHASIDLVKQASIDDMTRPTPCDEWTLRGLLSHMVTQNYGFAAGARGEDELAAWRGRSLGDRPVEAYQESAEHVIEAFAAADVLDTAFPLPELSPEPVPAPRAIGFHLVDYVVHGWDVARSLGTTIRFDTEVLDAALRIASAVPTDDAFRRAPGAAFAPVVSPPDNGSKLDDVLALLGRSPAWPE